MKRFVRRHLSIAMALVLLWAGSLVGVNAWTVDEGIFYRSYPVDGGVYYIHSGFSDFYLEPGSIVNTAESIYDLTQRAKKLHSVQRWRFIYYSGEGGYRIQNISTKGYLYVESGSIDSDARLLVTPSIYSNPSQIWVLQYDASGVIAIVNKKSSKSFTLYGSGIGYDGSKIVQWPLRTNNKWVVSPNGRTYSNYFIGTSYLQIKNEVDILMNSNFHDSNKHVTYPTDTTAGSMITSMRYSDFTWINTHGTSKGLWVCKNGTQVAYDYIHPDNVGILNNNTKWIAMQACSQLDLTKASQGTTNLAQNWAQTMGSTTGNRPHGILGYWGGAPSRVTELSIIDDFVANSQTGSSIFTSWKEANEPSVSQKYQWAILVYFYTATDKINSYRGNDQDYGSLYRYAYQANTAYMTAPASANAGSGIQFNMGKDTAIDSSVNFELQEKPFTPAQKSKLEGVLGAQRNDDNILMEIEDNGRLTYAYKNMDKYDVAIGTTAGGAIQTANHKLNELGLLPQEDYEVVVFSMIRNEMDPDGTTVGETETISYTVDYLKKASGMVLATDENDGIRVEVSSKGVVGIDYYWRELNTTPVLQKSLAKNQITKQKAMDVYTANVSNPDFAESNPQVTGEAMLWYQNGRAIPVYAFSNNGRFVNTVMVNRNTGEVVK